MSNPILPYDQNGNAIAVLAPRSSADHTLTDAFAEVLAADNANIRVVALYAANDGVYIRLGTDNATGMRLPQGALIGVKIDAGLALQAKGSGTLNVSVQG